MKRYIVTIAVDVDVEAESESEAIQKAKSELSDYDIDSFMNVYEEC